jgi:excisionase family DNA binding protein
MTETIYTIPEVAKYLKLSRSKVYYMVQRGTIPHVRIGKNVRITERDLRAWLDENSVGRIPTKPQ